MQGPPLSVTKAWPKPNYVNPETRGSLKVVLNVALYTILLCFVGLRIFTRTYLRKIFGGDDVLILLALLPTTAFFMISILADTKFLWTRHSYDIPADHISRGLKMVLATEILFAIACTLTKLSMLLLVRRILASASLFWRRITLFAIWIVALQGTIFCFTALFQCRPISAAWEVTVDKNPNCINDDVSLLVAGIINTLTDFVVVLLPIRAVWNLQLPSHHPQSIASDLRMKSLLPSRQTVPLVILFALGFLSCVAGALRTYYTWQISKTWDKIWASYPVWVWAALELYIGIICASIPATKPAFSHYLPSIFGSTSSPPQAFTYQEYSRYTPSYGRSPRPQSLNSQSTGDGFPSSRGRPRGRDNQMMDLTEAIRVRADDSESKNSEPAGIINIAELEGAKEDKVVELEGTAVGLSRDESGKEKNVADEHVYMKAW